MTTTSDNLLSVLHKWASGQDENFVTDAFAHLLRHLLSHDASAAAIIIRRLTNNLVEIDPCDARQVTIATQVATDLGRPDLEISLPGSLTYVEVKVESEIDQEQLGRYRSALVRSGVAHTALILLTRSPKGLDSTKETPDFHARWFMVAYWIQEQLDGEGIANASSIYLAEQFIHFLRSRNIAMQQLQPEMASGIQSMRSLLLMVYEILNALCNEVTRPRALDWAGCYCDTRKFFVGIYFDHPESLMFETQEFHFDKEAPERLGMGGSVNPFYGKWPHKWTNEFDLSTGNTTFYGLTQAQQMNQIELFIKECLEKAKQIEKLEP